MKRNIEILANSFVVVFCCIILFFNYSEAVAEQNNPGIIIKSVKIGAIDNDVQDSEYSVLINFSNQGESLQNWQLGFYMLGTSFYQIINKNISYNPRLIMEICDDANNCTRLHREKSKSITKPDLSQGYTTILSPIKSFPLLKSHSYTIKLLHNNQLGGHNITYLPQNFFLILPESKIHNGLRETHTISTEYDNYKFFGYEQKKIDAEINQHIKSNWESSIPYSKSPQNADIVPSPVKLKTNIGENFNIKNGIIIHNQLNNDNRLAEKMAEALQVDINVSAFIDNQTGILPGILIQPLRDKTVVQNNPEGYTIKINHNNIIIQSVTNAGAYYAFQTLRQLWNNGINNTSSILKSMSIVDYPRFKYRGLLLDTVRHFFSVPEIKSLIDIMGVHKLNTLHLHLSDDEAFRLALTDYPTLKIIGNVRGFGLSMGPMMFLQPNLYKQYYEELFVKADTVYSGSYSIDDIADIIAYANANQITVIPEIDLPAHSRALIKALPDAMIDPNDHSEYISAQGYIDNVLPICTYNTTISTGPKFTKTINNIVKQVASLFNGQTTTYAINNELSVGGDEVSPDSLTNNSSCQREWSRLSALQKSHKFFEQMALINPLVIFSGWQQLIQTDSPKLGETIVPFTRVGHIWVWNNFQSGLQQAIKLAKSGYPTVLAFSDKTYFDLAYSPDIHEPGLTWASRYGDTQAALSSALCITETLKDLGQYSENILGLEGTLWSENLANYHQLIYMALPKMAGLSEAGWSPGSVTVDNNRINWQSLAIRLGQGKQGFLAYLNKLFKARYRGYPNGIQLEVPRK